MSNVLRLAATYASSAGLKVSRTMAAASTNDTLVSGQPTNLFNIIAANGSASAKFVKLYNKATAPVVGDTPIVTILVPAGQTLEVEMTMPITFSLGLGFRITGAMPDADATVLAAGDVSVTLIYAN